MLKTIRRKKSVDVAWPTQTICRVKWKKKKKLDVFRRLVKWRAKNNTKKPKFSRYEVDLDALQTRRQVKWQKTWTCFNVGGGEAKVKQERSSSGHASHDTSSEVAKRWTCFNDSSSEAGKPGRVKHLKKILKKGHKSRRVSDATSNEVRKQSLSAGGKRLNGSCLDESAWEGLRQSMGKPAAGETETLR